MEKKGSGVEEYLDKVERHPSKPHHPKNKAAYATRTNAR